MPPRYTYWTILAGGLPTSFRAASKDDLLPTLKRLQDRHPDAVMKWFARGRLWASPEDAREASLSATARRRSQEWRPGGEHLDPRGKIQAARRARNQKRRELRFERKHATPEVNPAPGDISRPRRRSTQRRDRGPRKESGR
jgi:hypothetical protein